MRITLDIDDDVHAAARDLAERKRTTAKKFISDVIREAPQARLQTVSTDRTRYASHVHGFNPVPGGGVIVTNELVNELCEEAGV